MKQGHSLNNSEPKHFLRWKEKGDNGSAYYYERSLFFQYDPDSGRWFPDKVKCGTREWRQCGTWCAAFTCANLKSEQDTTRRLKIACGRGFFRYTIDYDDLEILYDDEMVVKA